MSIEEEVTEIMAESFSALVYSKQRNKTKKRWKGVKRDVSAMLLIYCFYYREQNSEVFKQKYVTTIMIETMQNEQFWD